MSSSDSKYCKQRITERGAECGRAIPLSNTMCYECFRRIDAAYTAWGQSLENRPAKYKRPRGAGKKAAPSSNERQVSRDTKEISKTNPGPQELLQPSDHRRKTNGDKGNSRR
ncbi:hypothetical protein BOTNAR_0290g00180 [Botryotinia narcissicola]|uniref:Uncharacterized protein n=1 Tax=Botryotinia narcissicola TaxID=278944 RepID=A0A4Z1HX65_9HELO|nr:hypothetical protein BOTNAR_0290g00180 [Botryotinia narcissicola]